MYEIVCTDLLLSDYTVSRCYDPGCPVLVSERSTGDVGPAILTSRSRRGLRGRIDKELSRERRGEDGEKMRVDDLTSSPEGNGEGEMVMKGNSEGQSE